MTATAGIATILFVRCNGRAEALVRNLQQQGYLLLHAADAAEAIEIARVHSRPIHIMIAEENVDSRSLAATLKLYRPQMRVLFLTQFTSSDKPDLANPETAMAKVRDLLLPFHLGPKSEEREAPRASSGAA